MLENLLKKINDYKINFYKKYDSLYSTSHKRTKEILNKSKKKFEIQRIRLDLKRDYYKLGKYVAKQYLLKGYSDFSLDEKFHELSEEIKKTTQIYNQIKKNY